MNVRPPIPMLYTGYGLPTPPHGVGQFPNIQFELGAIAEPIDRTLLEQCIDTCERCRQACEECFESMLRDATAYTRWYAVQALRDCIDLCTMAAGMLARGSVYSSQVLRLCVAVCEACASYCGQLSAPLSQACARACHACAHACRSFVI